MKFSLYSSNGIVKFVGYYATIAATVFLIGSSNSIARDSLAELLRTTLLAGLVLGIDVGLASASSVYRYPGWKARFLWAYRVAASHSILPLLGLTVCLGAASHLSSLDTLIGICGAGLLVLLYGPTIKAALFPPVEHSEDSQTNTLQAQSSTSWRSQLMLVVAVSLDSLLYGPAFSGGRTGWSAAELSVCFLGAGLVVGLIAIVSLGLSGLFLAHLTEGGLVASRRLTGTYFAGMLLETTVISYFAWNAALQGGLHIKMGNLMCFCFATLFAAVYFRIFRRQLWAEAAEEAKGSLSKV